MTRFDDSFRLYLLRTAVVLLLVVVATVVAVIEETRQWTYWGGEARWTVFLLFAFAFCFSWVQVLVWQGRSSLMHRLVWLAAAALVLLHFTMKEMGILATFVAFWVSHAPRLYSLRVSSRLAFGAAAFYLLMHYVRGDDGFGETLLLAAVVLASCLFVLYISYTAIWLQRERDQVLDLNRDLKAAQLQLARAARSDERLRIARELHDVLGHQMTALILNLEVARHRTTGDGLSHVERALALAKMLLGGLRDAVSDMRENQSLDFDLALAELISGIPALRVQLECEDGLTVNDPATAEVLLRCIQEALTNTLRHSRATSCLIRLYRQGAEVVLEVSDDGASPRKITPGNGLTGMRERIVALAGTLSWHGGNGFHLQVRLPVPGAAA